jgi:hypothetical protein
LRLLIGRHQRRRAEQQQQEHRQLHERRRALHQPREPRVHALQEPPGPGAADAERDLVDDVGRERAQVEEELIQRGQRPQSPLAEPREIGPVELEEIDGAIVGAPAQRHPRGLVQGVALRELEASEEIIVQREAEIGGGRRLLRLVEPARRAGPPSRHVGSSPVARRRARRCVADPPARFEPRHRHQDFVDLTGHVARGVGPAVAEETRELAHGLSRALIGYAVDHDDGDAFGRAQRSLRIARPVDAPATRARILGAL